MKHYFYLLLLAASNAFGQNVNVTPPLVFDGEPTLAVHPSNSQQLVAAWIGLALGQSSVIRTSTSSDGGATWSTSQYLPHIVPGFKSADPSLQYNNNGEVFLSYVDYDGTNFTQGSVVIRKSADNGLTWGPAVEVISTSDCPNKLCVDRPWMEIDRSGGPNDGTIYVTSMNANQPSIVVPPYNPYLSVSIDNGASFLSPRYLDTVNYLAGSTIGQPMPTPAIGADGTFYASYPSYETSQSVYAHLYLASSTSQGANVDHANLYTVLMAGVSDPLAKKAGKLMADPSTPNHLVMLNLSEESGDADLYFMETFDAVNWTTPARVNQDPLSNGKMQDLIWGAFNEQGDLAICWRDRRNAASSGYQTDTEIYGVIRYKDSVNFENDFAISSQQAAHNAILNDSGNDFLSVRFVGDTLYTIWGDVRTGVLSIYINRMSVSNGTSSLTEIHTEESLIHIFPNPAEDLVHIENFDLVENCTLYDQQGRQLSTVDHPDLNVRHLAPGSYFICYTADGRHYSASFVKK